MPAAEAPILLLDSGFGGLSVLGPVLAAVPRAPIVYAADLAGLPYGEKSELTVASRVCALLGRLCERIRPRLAIIACNTASTIALAQVRAVLDTPMVGTVPAIKPAAAISTTRTIGVLGTAATIRQPYVDDLARQFASDCRIIRAAAPALVVAAEEMLRGQTGNADAAAQAAIARLRSQPGGGDIDTIVLACTHFPLVQAALARAAGPGVAFVDGAGGIARRVTALTAGQPWPDSPPLRRAVYSAGGGHRPPGLAALAPYGITQISAI